MFQLYFLTSNTYYPDLSCVFDHIIIICYEMLFIEIPFLSLFFLGYFL